MKVLEEQNRAPMKLWEPDGFPFEHEAMQQIRNVASLPFIHRHVAVMADAHFGIGATVGTVIATKGVVIPASVGVDIGCFAGPTKIPLLDGTQVTLYDLSKRSKPFWVYSLAHDLGVTPGRATARLTRHATALVRVVISGGDDVLCTPDHLFMLSNGTWREAKDLRFNDGLMPLYRRWQTN